MEYPIEQLERNLDNPDIVYVCPQCKETALKPAFHITNNQDDTDDIEPTGDWYCEECNAEFIEDNKAIKLTGYKI